MEVVGAPETESGSSQISKSGDLSMKTEGPPGGKVFPVKLGKFKNVDGGGEGCSTTTTTITGNINAGTTGGDVDSRRCFSMGSFEYVMDETATLQVPIGTLIKKHSSKSGKTRHRAAISECGCQSRRYLVGLGATRGTVQPQDPNDGNAGSSNSGEVTRKKDSFSISKIWLRERREKQRPNDGLSSRRAFSFRLPVNRGWEPKDGRKIDEANGATCEIEIGSEMEEEARSCDSLDYSQASIHRAPSFTRRTLLWLMGRQTQNKVGHLSSPSLDQVQV